MCSNQRRGRQSARQAGIERGVGPAPGRPGHFLQGRKCGGGQAARARGRGGDACWGGAPGEAHEQAGEGAGRGWVEEFGIRRRGF